MGVMKALGKFISEGQEVAAARALKKYFEKNAKQASETPKRKRTPKASKQEPEKSDKTPPPPSKTEEEDGSEDTGSIKKGATGAGKPAKATRNVLPNPPGFTRKTDPKTGKPQRGRAPNAEKVAWAEEHAGDTEVQKWAEENDVKLPEPAPSSKPPAPKPPAPESGNKPPAPPSGGFGPPPGPPPAL